jgi:hypothetical protein
VLAVVLGGPGPHIIEIASNKTYTNQWIVIPESVTLLGGFEDCVEATPSGPPTVLSGAGGGVHPVVQADGGTIELVDLVLQQGEASGLQVVSGAVVFLIGTTVRLNTASDGGGIQMLGGVVSIDEDSVVTDNAATSSGGGITARPAVPSASSARSTTTPRP